MTTQALGQEQAQPHMITAAEIASRIEKRAGVTVTSHLSRVSWFPRRSSLEVQQALLIAPAEEHRGLYESLKPTELVAGKPCPLGNAGLKAPRMIFEMFENDEEIRVYTLGQDSPPGVIRLSKKSPNFTIRDFTMEAFIGEVADEWSEFADSMSTAEKERESVLEYGRSLPATYSLGEFLQDVQSEIHLEGADDQEEEEEEEETDEEPEASTVPASPTALSGGGAAVKVD
jgi:hypothetical protein